MNRLVIQNLSKSYIRGVKALDQISLQLPNGMFGLLGPNGAGKSSFMRTLATLQLPDEGLFLFDGINMIEKPQQMRDRLGYLPQDFGVYPKLSAMDLLTHFAVLKGITHRQERKEQVLALLQQTNLFAVRNRAVSNFSGGMRQRFGIAQALLGDPQLIIVDEPTAGLDPLERNRFHELLSDIGEKKVVILSTHIVEDVHDLCPEMAVMANGKIVIQGKPGALTEMLNGRIWRATIDKPALNYYQQQFDVISTKISAGRTQVFVIADSCPAEEFTAVYPDLEDVYFATLFGLQMEGKERIQ